MSIRQIEYLLSKLGNSDKEEWEEYYKSKNGNFRMGLIVFILNKAIRKMDKVVVSWVCDKFKKDILWYKSIMYEDGTVIADLYLKYNNIEEHEFMIWLLQNYGPDYKLSRLRAYEKAKEDNLDDLFSIYTNYLKEDVYEI